MKKSGSFDGIANKFDKNIYGTSKGKLRHLLLLHYLDDLISTRTPLRVLDAGAGTGMMSLAFAKAGHKLSLIDVSSQALDIAKARLADFDDAEITCAQISDLQTSARFDLILCHAVLEWLESPEEAIDTLLSHLTPEGTLSLSFFNKDALLFNNAIYGNFDYIAKGMKVKNVVRLNPNNPQSPSDILAYLQQRDDISITLTAGIRCFHDYMRDKRMQDTLFDDILALEKRYGQQAPFMYLGKYFYLRVKKNT